jgi:uncharacterized protein (TIGR02301 family)
MFRHALCAATLILATLAGAAAPAAAQSKNAPLDTLVQLAETLGQAHALRSVCTGDGDQTWRNYMMNMLAMEAPSGPRRSPLTSAFNRGYRAQSARMKTCTASAPAEEAAIAARGRALAESVAQGYLN